MAHEAVVQAVEARLKAGFSACPINTENDGGAPPDDGSAFMTLTFPWSRSEWQTIAAVDGEFYEEGAFRIVLAIPSGSGAHQARTWLTDIADLFRAADFGGVRTFAPSSPVTDDRSSVAGYFRLSIAVPYQFYL